MKSGEQPLPLVDQINYLNKEISNTNSEIRKIEDMLEGYLECK